MEDLNDIKKNLTKFEAYINVKQFPKNGKYSYEKFYLVLDLEFA